MESPVMTAYTNAGLLVVRGCHGNVAVLNGLCAWGTFPLFQATFTSYRAADSRPVRQG